MNNDEKDEVDYEIDDLALERFVKDDVSMENVNKALT